MNDYELYHHGIKGQKWGRRRFQTNDGSLTAAGRKRYADDDSSGSSKSKTSAKSTASKSSSSKSKTASSTTKKKTTKKTTKKTSPASVVGKLAGTSVKTAVSLYAGPRVNSFMSTPTYRAFLSSPYATGTRYGTGWWLD